MIDPEHRGETGTDQSAKRGQGRKLITHFIVSRSPNDNSGVAGKKSKSGRLTPNLPSIETVHWPAYDISSQQIMLLESQKFSVKSFYRASKMALWLDLLPNIHRTSHHLDQCTYNQLDNSENTTYFDGSLLSLPCPQDKLGKDKNNGDSKSSSSPSSSSKRAHHEPDAQTQPNSSPANTYLHRKLSNKISPSISTLPQHNKHTIFQSLTTPGLFSSFHFVENNRQHQKPGQDINSFEYGENDAEETLPDGSSKTIVRSVHPHGTTHQHQNLPLVVVIGVGCVLLSGNIFLFLGVYCRKRRRGRRKNAAGRSSNLSDSDTADQFYRKQQQQPQKFSDTTPHCNDNRRDLKPPPKTGHGSLGRNYKHQVHHQDSPLFAGNVSPYHASRDDSLCLNAMQNFEHSEGMKTYPSRFSRPTDTTCRFESVSSCQKGVKFSDSEIASDKGTIKNQASHLQLILEPDLTLSKHESSTNCYNKNIMLDQHPSTNATLLKSSTMKNTTTTPPQATSSSFSTVFPSAPNQQPTKLLSMSSSNYICSRPAAAKNHSSPATKISETAIDCDILSDTIISPLNFKNSNVSGAEGTATFHDTKPTYTSYLHHASSSKPLVSFNSSPTSTSSKRDADV